LNFDHKNIDGEITGKVFLGIKKNSVFKNYKIAAAIYFDDEMRFIL